MSLLIKIDHRENKLKELCQECDYIKHEQLQHADIQFIYNDIPILLFERKTIDDLLASIKDGRYKNQKINLFQAGYIPQQICFIIEGNIEYSTQHTNNLKSIQSSIINTMLRDQIKVFFTKSLNETSMLILSIFQKVKDKPTDYIIDKFSEVSSTDDKVIITSNKSNSKSNIFRAMLCQIPGISQKIALCINKEYSTINEFYTILSPLNKDERKKKLESIKTVDDKGKSRKISSKVIDSIIDIMWNDEK